MLNRNKRTLQTILNITDFLCWYAMKLILHENPCYYKDHGNTTIYRLDHSGEKKPLHKLNQLSFDIFLLCIILDHLIIYKRPFFPEGSKSGLL